MKNRLIITVSDIRGTKSYNLHQFIKKILLFIIIAIVLVLLGSFWFINYLDDQIEVVKQNKEKELKVLEEKEQKLVTQNKFYSMQIESKVKDIEGIKKILGKV